MRKVKTSKMRYALIGLMQKKFKNSKKLLFPDKKIKMKAVNY